MNVSEIMTCFSDAGRSVFVVKCVIDLLDDVDYSLLAVTV